MRTAAKNGALGAMEFFILALIAKAGLRSLYDLQQRAGLQPGGIRPALRRLEQRELLVRAEAGSRRRRAMSLTSSGIALLNDSWRMIVEQDYPDIESVLRAATVAILMGHSHRAGEYLWSVGCDRERSAGARLVEADRIRKAGADELSVYLWMRTLCEAERRRAEGQALQQLGRSFLEQHPPDVRADEKLNLQ